MPKLVLDRKVKYKGKSYPVNAKGVTKPVPVKKEDVKSFEGMIVEAFDDDNKKLYLDKRDKAIEELEEKIKELQARLAKKDEIILDLEVEVEELKGNMAGLSNNNPAEPGTHDDNSKDNTPGEPLDEKTVEDLYTMAGELDISGRSKLRNDKDALLKAVKTALAEKAGE